jgi:hypothetical protein
MFMSARPLPAEGEAAPRAAAVIASLLCLVPAVIVAVAPGWVMGRM